MKNLKLKKVTILIILTLIILIAIPTLAKATNENLAIIKDQEDYIIYKKDYENTNFQFAITNEDYTEEQAKTNLTFINHWTDTNNINVAGLDNAMGIDKSQEIYLWIKNEDNTYEKIQLNLNETIILEDMQNIENFTKIIDVDTTQKNSKEEDINGVKVTTTTGKIVITDDSENTYRYQLIKIDENTSENAKELMNLVNTLQTDYASMNMYNKTITAIQINKLYTELLNSATWLQVDNMEILQPETSKDGEQYIVLLQKMSNGIAVSSDIQFLTCFEGQEKEIQKTTNVKKVTTALPVTYESIALFVILAIVIIALIIVAIKISKIKKNTNNEK